MEETETEDMAEAGTETATGEAEMGVGDLAAVVEVEVGGLETEGVVAGLVEAVVHMVVDMEVEGEV